MSKKSVNICLLKLNAAIEDTGEPVKVISEKAGLHPDQLSQYTHGTSTATHERWKKIADAVGLELKDLMEPYGACIICRYNFDGECKIPIYPADTIRNRKLTKREELRRQQPPVKCSSGCRF